MTQPRRDPSTELDHFFMQIGRASAQVAPVAATRRCCSANMADTFEAISASPRCLQETIEKAAPTLDAAIELFRVQRPFLADFADLSRRLRPAARELRRSLPAINSAFEVGTPVLPKTVELNQNLEDAFDALDDLFENPTTLLALRDLDTALTRRRAGHRVRRPVPDGLQLLQLLHPPAGRGAVGRPVGPDGRRHVAEPDHEGAQLAPAEQLRHVDRLAAVGHPRRTRTRRAPKDMQGNDLFRLYAPPYQPAIDAQGNADCQLGQNGYPNGPLNNGRYNRGDITDGSDEHGLPTRTSSARAATARSCRTTTTSPASRAAPT